MSNYTTESDTGILTENEELRGENEVATVPTASRRKQGAAFGGYLLPFGLPHPWGRKRRTKRGATEENDKITNRTSPTNK